MPTEYKLPEYTAYFDTNAAVSKEPGNQISTQLLKGIERSRSLTAVDVRAPAVVIEELIYQKFKVAKAAASNLRKNSRTLADICKSPDMEPPSDEGLEAGIRNQFEECLRRSAITVISTPLKQIDWESVVADSCWRRPPFEKPKSEDDHAEKGFRDKIILETSIIDLGSVKSGVIAFISNDNMLRTTYQERAQCDLLIEVYCGFDEFIAHLELLQKIRSDEFTKEVLDKVGAVFYDPDDPSCVAISRGVINHLTNEYSDELARPPFLDIGSQSYSSPSDYLSTFTPPVAATPIPPADWLAESKFWSPVTELKAVASPPVFEPNSSDGQYHWKSTVTLARLLRRNTPRWNQSYSLPEERIRIMDIDVLWSCAIRTEDAQFSDYQVDDYVPTLNDKFIEADWRTRSSYDLPLIPGPEDANP